MVNNKFCIECGFELPRTAKFCEKCGAKLSSMQPVRKTADEVENMIEDEQIKRLVAKELGLDVNKMNETIKESFRNKTCVNCFDELSTMKIKELNNSSKGYVYCEKCEVEFYRGQDTLQEELGKTGFYEKEIKTESFWRAGNFWMWLLIFFFILMIIGMISP